MTHAIDQARDLLATAATLGLPVSAPAGTTVYYYQVVVNRGLLTSSTPEICAGIHATYDGAIQALADLAITVHDTTRRVAGSPWGCPDFWADVTGEQWRSDMPGWTAAYRAAQDHARDTWITGRTPQQILDALAPGWTATPVTVQA
jgi:hypothetical protein